MRIRTPPTFQKYSLMEVLYFTWKEQLTALGFQVRLLETSCNRAAYPGKAAPGRHVPSPVRSRLLASTATGSIWLLPIQAQISHTARSLTIMRLRYPVEYLVCTMSLRMTAKTIGQFCIFVPICPIRRSTESGFASYKKKYNYTEYLGSHTSQCVCADDQMLMKRT